MFVISILNQKGGVGKTTIATHLATYFHMNGYKTLLVDGDTQGSARDWSAARENEDDDIVPVVGIDRPTIDKDIKHVTDKDIIIIDGAPQAADLAISAIKASNLILIPVQPSPFDIWATNDLCSLVKQRIEITDGKVQAAFIVHRVITGTNLGKEIRDVLADFNLPVLESQVSQRIIFAKCAINGKTALHFKNTEKDAAREIENLAQEIISKYLTA